MKLYMMFETIFEAFSGNSVATACVLYSVRVGVRTAPRRGWMFAISHVALARQHSRVKRACFELVSDIRFLLAMIYY